MAGGTIVGVTQLSGGMFRLLVECGEEWATSRLLWIARMADCRLLSAVGDRIRWDGKIAYWTRRDVLGIEYDELLEIFCYTQTVDC